MSLFGSSTSSEPVISEESWNNPPFEGGIFGNTADSLPESELELPDSNSMFGDSHPFGNSPTTEGLPEGPEDNAENYPYAGGQGPIMSHPFGESLPGAGPEGIPEGLPETGPASIPENPPFFSQHLPEMIHPFGENLPGTRPEGIPEGSPETGQGSIPENSQFFGQQMPEMVHPFGESFKGIAWVPEGEPETRGEPEPEGEGMKLPDPVMVDMCEREWNPWAEPEAEPEGAYGEPPAPLLQPSRIDERGTYSTLAAIVATLIITLNIAVIVVLLRKPKQRKSLTYLLGLTAAFDMLGGFQFLWFSSFDVHLMLTHANMWIIVMCGIWMMTMAPQISALMHFGLHLLDELNVGVNNAKISPERIVFIVLTVFVLPVALFIPPLAGWNCIGCINPTEDLDYCAEMCSMAIFPFTKIYVLLMVVLLFTAMVIVISIYAAIYRTICHKRCERKLSPKSGKADVIRLTFSMLTVYLLCVLPVSIVMIFDYISVKCNPYVINAFHATLFVSFLSNLLNPIIVFYSLPSMRDAISRNQKSENGKLMKTISTSSTEKEEVNGAYAIDEKPPLDNEIPTEV